MNNLKAKLDKRSQQLNQPAYTVSKEYLKKKKELEGLMKVIELLTSSKVFSREQKQEIENHQFKLEFRLKTLIEKFADEEIQTKIDSFKEVVNYLKSI